MTTTYPLRPTASPVGSRSGERGFRNPAEMQLALPAGNERRANEVADDVQDRPAHVEEAVHSEDDPDPLRRDSDGLEDDHDQGERTSRHSGRPDARQDG